MTLNRTPARDRLGRLGWRTGSSYQRSRVTLAEERSLTSGVSLEETKSPEIGFAYQLHVWIRRSRKGLDSSAKTHPPRSHDEIQGVCRVRVSEASRRAGCGKSACPVR